MLHILINPAAGCGQAETFVQENVTTLLNKLDQPYRIWKTAAPGHAGTIAQEILREHADQSHVVKVVVAGGDGTAHELIEGVKSLRSEAGSPEVKWELIILPLGTANALHASLFSAGSRALPAKLEGMVPPDPDIRKSLSSLLAALDASNHPKRLPIATTRMYHSNGAKSSDSPIYSHIVTSTSLHAALLQTSEELRAEHPGLERFKIAAERNLGVFFQAQVRLLPSAKTGVRQYDPKTKSFVRPFTVDGEDTLDGPFTYLLSTTVCERLEPTFVINPTLKTIPPDPEEASMDIVILRPLRDPDVSRAAPADQQEKWKKRAMEVIGHAYKGGAHVNLLYPDAGGETVLHGTGQVAVETFRVGGFEWTPTQQDQEPSQLVCADGAIHTIPVGGRARVSVSDHNDGDHSFWVWS